MISVDVKANKKARNKRSGGSILQIFIRHPLNLKCKSITWKIQKNTHCCHQADLAKWSRGPCFTE